MPGVCGHSEYREHNAEERAMATASVRYIVQDVDAAIAFYTRHLGFNEEMQPAPTFAMLSRGDLRLLLSAPSGAGGGGQAMPDGTMPEPGGWNPLLAGSLRPCGDGRGASQSRRPLPQRHRHRSRRQTDPARRPFPTTQSNCSNRPCPRPRFLQPKRTPIRRPASRNAVRMNFRTQGEGKRIMDLGSIRP